MAAAGAWPAPPGGAAGIGLAGQAVEAADDGAVLVADAPVELSEHAARVSATTAASAVRGSLANCMGVTPVED
jgi:hypothetical protein